ncbi:MFS transporter [Natronolimnobius sp. AArcel1]|uniref:MFS transporter n=1 Tax=Natronolimnobius sp. AArcel1 TaxID=1679093 RepID=UPI0013EB612C|nr:MFS transporter [Natronolimnobius sp. AArcel1]NGM69076.1 MFS transporter [Natronolimnobius sp. AArcel1]
MAEEPDPATVADAAADFCADTDDGEAILETVLAVDGDHETWTFDDLPLDSGTFGELVSRDIVVRAGDEYRVASRDGVRATLEGESLSTEESAPGPTLAERMSIDFDGRALAGLIGALAVVVAMRLLNFRSVFQGDHVVSPANDPYYYRYWTEELLAESDGLTDWSVVTAMPDGAAGTRPFTHAANWLFASLLGGDQWAAAMVAAWVPIIMTVLLGIVVYWLAIILTDDVRVGLASVFLLALTPVHAVYTSVGFLEHRPYQYFWLGVTLLGLCWIAVDLQRRRAHTDSARAAVRAHLERPGTWLAAGAFGIALALSAHAWGGSALMFIPVAGYVGLKVALDARNGISPLLANLPVLVGLVVSAAVAGFLHLRWGWHEPFTAIVPVLVVVGAVVVAGLGELWALLEWPTSGLVGLEAVTAVVGLVAFHSLRPDEWAQLRERADDVFFREHHGATEIGSLFAAENAIILEPMAQIGIGFYIAIGVLCWACWVATKRYEPGWLLLGTYGIFWLALAAFQVRFAAQLSIVLSVLGGLGLVYLLSWVDLARTPQLFRTRDSDSKREQRARSPVADGGEREHSIRLPADRTKLIALVWVVLLICGLNLFFVPSLSAQTTYSDGEFDAAMAIDDHADAVDRADNGEFVLSQWGDNRMYNYFVSGDSQSYSYAANTYDDFIADDDPDAWYDDEFDGRVGYVVVTDRGEAPGTNAYVQLHQEHGIGGADDPLEHYQTISIDDEALAFAVVPGANITTTGESGETITVATEQTVSGETIEYERSVTVDDDGNLAVTVPYSGEYTVGDETVEVSESAVETGETVELE